MVQRETDGKGVDFVLNSLSEDKLLASVRCLGQSGHFLEIGKFDMANDSKLGLGCFLKELTFHAVLADSLLVAPDEDIWVIIWCTYQYQVQLHPLLSAVFEKTY